jgi:hypothetical protein
MRKPLHISSGRPRRRTGPCTDLSLPQAHPAFGSRLHAMRRSMPPQSPRPAPLLVSTSSNAYVKKVGAYRSTRCCASPSAWRETEKVQTSVVCDRLVLPGARLHRRGHQRAPISEPFDEASRTRTATSWVTLVELAGQGLTSVLEDAGTLLSVTRPPPSSRPPAKTPPGLRCRSPARPHGAP